MGGRGREDPEEGKGGGHPGAGPQLQPLAPRREELVGPVRLRGAVGVEAGEPEAVEGLDLLPRAVEPPQLTREGQERLALSSHQRRSPIGMYLTEIFVREICFLVCVNICNVLFT